MTCEGFPTTRRDDLRWYLSQDGRFTTCLRQHYDPLRLDPDQRQVFIKVGTTWLVVPFNLLMKNVVFRVREPQGEFVKWADDGTDLMFSMADAVQNRDGVWGVQARKPTEQELVEA